MERFVTDLQFKIVEKSLQNFFRLTSGQVFTNVDIHNPLEDILFEDLQEWHNQKLVESRIRAVLEENFKALSFNWKDIEFVADKKEKTLSISIEVKLRKGGGSYRVVSTPIIERK